MYFRLETQETEAENQIHFFGRLTMHSGQLHLLSQFLAMEQTKHGGAQAIVHVDLTGKFIPG